MPNGYNGKILHINLTTGEMDVEQPPESFYRKYMGGSALNTYYLLKEMPAGADPLEVQAQATRPPTGCASTLTAALVLRPVTNHAAIPRNLCTALEALLKASHHRSYRRRTRRPPL